MRTVPDRLHPRIHEAKRQAETLHRYRIKPAGNLYILWKWKDGWMAVGQFPSRETAEDHLHAKLPCIESEL